MAYGFEIKNSSNQVVLDSSDTTMRIIHVEYVAYSACITGSFYSTHTNTPYTFTVSNFDSTRGSYYVRAHMSTKDYEHLGITPNVLDSVTDVNHNFHTSPRRFCGAGAMWTPTLSWNNSTKQMTFTHPGPMNTAHYSTSIISYDFGNSEVVFLEWA